MSCTVVCTQMSATSVFIRFRFHLLSLFRFNILCVFIVCHEFFIVALLDSVVLSFQCQANRLAGRNVSIVACFVSTGMYNLNWISQSVIMVLILCRKRQRYSGTTTRHSLYWNRCWRWIRTEWLARVWLNCTLLQTVIKNQASFASITKTYCQVAIQWLLHVLCRQGCVCCRHFCHAQTEYMDMSLWQSDLYAVLFYRTMHYSAKRSLAIACRLSVHLWCWWIMTT